MPSQAQIRPGLIEVIAHSLQVLNLTHSWYNIFAYLLKPINVFVTYVREYNSLLHRYGIITSSHHIEIASHSFIHPTESIRANKADYLYHKRVAHGENFVCAGGVWMSNFNEVKKNLIEPQARAFKLAPSELDQEHLPRTVDGRLLFLLGLSQRGAAGNGDWEAYRAAFEDYITHTEETKLRMNDETTKKLMDKLVSDYKDTGLQKEGEFFDNSDTGIQDYLLRYLHYVLMGLDPFDEEKMTILKEHHYDTSSAGYYLRVSLFEIHRNKVMDFKSIISIIAFHANHAVDEDVDVDLGTSLTYLFLQFSQQVMGNVLQNLRFRSWPEKIEQVTKIYEESPALSKMEGGQEKYNNMSRNDLAKLTVSIMAIAGLIGPFTLCKIVLGNQPLPDYDGQTTKNIDVLEFWDQINLDDREEVKKYIYECGRLRHPVSNSHKVATEDFTARIGNRDVEFKKGTIVFIPMVLAGLDSKVYGKDTFEFNQNRENLCPFSTIFHSFGDQTNGRVCPGKPVADSMITDILINLGKSRREAS